MSDNRIINPKTGRPFTPSKQVMTQHITRAHMTGVRQPFPGYSIATGLTPERLAAVLRNAIEGSLEDYLILAEEMEERDLHYASQLRTRKLAVAGLEPTVESASDDARDVALADEIRELVRMPQFSDMLQDLLDGLGKGFSVVEILWGTDGGRWQPNGFHWADPRFFCFDRETGRELRLYDATPEGERLADFKYLVHTPRMKSGLPIRNGLARLAATMYMLKGYTLKDWWSFAEVFGMPIRVGKYGRNATDEEIATLVNAVANIATDAGAAIPESMQLEMVEAARGSGGETLFENMADWADRQISKGVLGQTMTADSGSSRSQAEVHDEVRKDIMTDDARQLCNTLNSSLVRWFIDLNHGPQKQYPRICLPVIEAEDLDRWTQSIERMVKLGLRVEQSFVRDKLGVPDPDKGADILGVPPSPREAEKNPTALNREQPADPVEDDLTELRDELLADWEPVMQAVTDPIQALADRCESYEEFLARLPELLEEGGMDATVLMQRLAEATYKARAHGDVDD